MKKNNEALRWGSRFRTVTAAIALAMAAAMSAAHAAPFTLTFGDAGAAPTIVDYRLVSATDPTQSLTARIEFDLLSITAAEARFAVTVTNTTAPTTPGANRLVSFGVRDVGPDLSGSAVVNDDIDYDATSLINRNFPGFGSFDLCAIWRSNAKNCAGGGNGGLREGETDRFTWILFGMFGASPTVSFDSPIAIRFQSIDERLWDGGSITFDALSPQVPSAPPGEQTATQPPISESPVTQAPTGEPPVAPASEQPLQVPEPGSAMLVGLGLLGAALARRRQSRHA